MNQYLENHQTVPDIQLMNEYDVVIKGKDQQLEAAVNALIERNQIALREPLRPRAFAVS
jgi:hypothetical protein